MEKRRHQRITANFPATVRHGGRLFEATVLNLSSGGMCLETETSNLKENASIEVTFDLTKGERDLSLCGIVTRVEEASANRVGVQFINVFSTSHNAIREFVHKQLIN